MKAAVKAEWIKLITTRTFKGLVFGAGAIAAFIVFGFMARGGPPWDALKPLNEMEAWAFAVLNVSVFGLILGAKTFTDEVRYGSIVHTFFADPARRKSMVAKAIAAAGGTMIVAAATIVMEIVATYGLAAVTGGEINFGLASLVGPALGVFGAAALWAVLGVGLGAIVKNQVPAAISALMWVLVVENIFSAVAGDAARYLPGRVSNSIGQVVTSGETIAMSTSVALMVAYAAVAWVLGMLFVRRRDVA